LMIGNEVRDKDAVSAVALLCEMAAVERSKGRSLFDKLVELYLQYGLYKESLISITKKGMNGALEIAAMMQDYREHPPMSLDGIRIKELLDYELQIGKNMFTGESWPIKLPKSNVLQFVLEDGSKISARPSGTEPKIKFYFSVKGKLEKASDFEMAEKSCDEKINRIAVDLKLK